MNGSLFDPSPDFPLDELRERLDLLTREKILIGTSSWKYEGWIGQIYSHANYVQRGRFSKKLFDAACLREYAGIFPTVCGDFAFYQFPTPEFWHKLFSLAPETFRFALKVPEQITCKLFPVHARYGALAGLENPSFLDAHLLEEAFLKPLDPYRDRLTALIFEFGAFSWKAMPSVNDFLELLDPFLARLPKTFRYAVEIRTPEFLTPEYFDCLRSHGVAHVFNAWSKMPELDRQLALPESITAPFVVCRALVRRGRQYEEAVEMFKPYTEIKEENPEARRSLRELIERCRARSIEAYIYINNRLEGNAPQTVLDVIRES